MLHIGQDIMACLGQVQRLSLVLRDLCQFKICASCSKQEANAGREQLERKEKLKAGKLAVLDA